MSALTESSKQGIDLKAIEAIVNPIIWQWVNAHADDVVFQYHGKVWIIPINVSVHVSNLRGLITQLVGPEQPSTPLSA